MDHLDIDLPDLPSCAFCSVPIQGKYVTFPTHAALVEHYKERHTYTFDTTSSASSEWECSM